MKLNTIFAGNNIVMRIILTQCFIFFSIFCFAQKKAICLTTDYASDCKRDGSFYLITAGDEDYQKKMCEKLNANLMYQPPQMSEIQFDKLITIIKEETEAAPILTEKNNKNSAILSFDVYEKEKIIFSYTSKPMVDVQIVLYKILTRMLAEDMDKLIINQIYLPLFDYKICQSAARHMSSLEEAIFDFEIRSLHGGNVPKQ